MGTFKEDQPRSGAAPTLGEETAQRVAALCRTMAGAHGLTSDVEDELRSHIEEKLFAYLAGEEALTEADALILVERHFGDPEEVKALLAEVHVADTAVDMTRRLAAVTLLTLAVMNLFCLIEGTVMRLLLFARIGSPELLVSGGGLWPKSVLAILMVCGIWFVLSRWMLSIAFGRVPPILKTPLPLMALALCVLVAVYPFTDAYRRAPWALQIGTAWPMAYHAAWLVVLALSVIANLALWVWWCSPGTHRFAALLRIWLVSSGVLLATEWAQQLFILGERGRLTIESIPGVAVSGASTLVVTAIATPLALLVVSAVRRIAARKRAQAIVE